MLPLLIIFYKDNIIHLIINTRINELLNKSLRQVKHYLPKLLYGGNLLIRTALYAWLLPQSRKTVRYLSGS